MNISLAFYMLGILCNSCVRYDDILRGGDDLSTILKRTPKKVELICVWLIHTSRFGASKYEYPYLGRRHT